MEEVKEKLREINALMPYGRVKALAREHGVEYRRAMCILRAEVQMDDAEEAFVFACWDEAKKIKNRNNKILTF